MLCVLILTAFASLGSVCAAGQSAFPDVQSKEDFLTLYQPFFEQIKAVYGNATFVASYRETKGHSAALLEDATITYRLREGQLARIDRMSRITNVRISSVARPDLSFTVQRQSNAADYTLTDIQSDYAGKLGAMQVGYHLLAPAGIFEVAIPDYVRLPEVTFVSFQAVDREDACLARLRLHHRVVVDGSERTRDLDLDFDPKAGWVLRSFTSGRFDQPKGQRQRGELTYGENFEGVGVVRRAEYWYEKQGQRIGRQQLYDYERFDPKAPPPSDFALAAFGIPDVHPVRRSYAPYFVVTLGLLAIAAGIWLRRRLAAARGS